MFELIYAATGHRIKSLGLSYSKSDADFLKNFAKKHLSEKSFKLIITGGAIGWDQAVAEACIELDIPYKVYIPFIGQESKWPKHTQKNYHKILDLSEEVQIICEDGYAPWKMQVRNEFMVDDADAILALYSGIGGGTKNCIEYAEKKNKPIYNVWEDFLNEKAKIK